MSRSAWVEAFGVDAPPALVARVREVIDAEDSLIPLPIPAGLIRVSEILLAGVISRPEAGREVALDLLAADACVTWAFEFEAGGHESLSKTAEGAMSTIAALAK